MTTIPDSSQFSGCRFENVHFDSGDARDMFYVHDPFREACEAMSRFLVWVYIEARARACSWIHDIQHARRIAFLAALETGILRVEWSR